MSKNKFQVYILIIIFLSISFCTSNIHEYMKFQQSYDNSVFHNISFELQSNIKIFCVILTTPKNKEAKCIPQKNTWLKRCNNYVFASTINDKTLPSIKSFRHDDYKYSYGKIKNAFRWVKNNYNIDEYDYFLKADDDTYFIMENLRGYLINKNPDKYFYFGFRVYNPPNNIKNAYIQGGAGYVMSKVTFKTLVEKGFNNPNYCSQRNDMFDDMEIGRCLNRMGIYTSFLLDDKYRILFNPQDLASTIMGRKNQKDFFERYGKIYLREGYNAMSDYPISFHYIKGDFMYVLEYLFYHAQVIGMTTRMDRIENSDKVGTMKKVQQRMELIKMFTKYNYRRL
uniref:N-acetylgalactosaminide beta-1,3-galactosyltransferase n=1 Tax=Parastrongyloides trichosuri TaxID=131310 RepID=A0A0N4ZDC1_PARTI